MARDITIRILGNAQSAKDAFDSTEKRAGDFGSKLDAFSKKAAKVGAGMTAAVTLPIVAIGKVAFDAASDLNESISKVGVVFGDNAADIEAWAQNAATSLGMSRQAALEATGTFGNFLQSMGLAHGPAADMSKDLVGLASDLASFNNANPEEVLLALRSGLSGEAEPMRKFGVALSETAVKAKAAELGLGDIHGELTEGEKIQARYAIIMEQTKTAQGDFARTSDGAANKQRILAAQFSDTVATIGNTLMPIGQQLLEWVGQLGEWFNRLSPQTQKFIFVIAGVAAAIGPVVGIVGAFGTALGILLSPVTLIVVGIAALVAGLIYAYLNFEGFRNAVDAVASWLRDTAWPILQAFFEGVIAVSLAVVSWFQTNWPTISAIFQTTWDVLVGVWNTVGIPLFEAIKLIVQGVIDFIQVSWPIVSAIVNTVWEVVRDFWNSVGAPIFTTIQTVVQTLIDWFGTTFDAIRVTFETVWGAVQGAWNTVGAPIFNTIKTVIDGIAEAARIAKEAMDAITGFGNLGANTIDVDSAKADAERKWREAHPGQEPPSARASGGPVLAGKSYVVGERGPELVTMGGNGYVTPNHALGGGNVININVNGAGDPKTVAQEVLRQVQRFAKRNGGLSQQVAI